MAAFLEDFMAYRFDDVLGAWKPYREVLHRSLERSGRRWGVAFDPADAQAIVEAVPTWGPHADVPAALAKVAEVLPLVTPTPPIARSGPMSTSWARRFTPC